MFRTFNLEDTAKRLSYRFREMNTMAKRKENIDNENNSQTPKSTKKRKVNYGKLILCSVNPF